MSLVDSGYYESARRGIDDQYAAQMAANTYSRTLSQQRGNRSLSEMQTGFRRSIPGFTSGFAQRGFGGGGIRSGVMQRSMSNYLGDFQRQYGNAQNDLTEQLRQFDLNAAQMGSNRTRSLADLELQKQREIAFAAQNVEALRSVFGGL
ncbi:MAG TPA: hypothetical protein VFX15_00240 [Actinomycetes bacterium]|nr:hypothetical protein [Actinomycetes bacterium]